MSCNFLFLVAFNLLTNQMQFTVTNTLFQFRLVSEFIRFNLVCFTNKAIMERCCHFFNVLFNPTTNLRHIHTVVYENYGEY